MLRILVVVTSLGKGGAEQVAAAIANEWHLEGHSVTVATVLDHSNEAGLSDRIEVVHLRHAGAAPGAVRRVLNNLSYVGLLRRLIKSRAPDVVIAHGDRTNVLALLAARRLTTPVVVVEHNDPRHHAIGRSWNALRRLVYPSATRIVAVSAGVGRALTATYGEHRTRVVCNPVLMGSADRPPAIGKGNVVAMGRLTYQKGFDVLLTAFASVARTRPAVRLTIWGEGEERANLERLADRLGIADRCRFPGFTNQPRAALLEGSIFVLPSRYEGFGLVLAEAMVLGMPAIAADCPSGPSEIVEDGVSGLLVPPEDPLALAKALSNVLDDDALAERLGGSARCTSERFSLTRAVAGWSQILSEAVTAG